MEWTGCFPRGSAISGGDGTIVEFRSVVDAVRGAIEVQGAIEVKGANRRPTPTSLPTRASSFALSSTSATWSRRLTMGDGANVVAQLEEICKPGALCLPSAAHEQVRGRHGPRRFPDWDLIMPARLSCRQRRSPVGDPLFIFEGQRQRTWPPLPSLPYPPWHCT